MSNKMALDARGEIRKDMPSSAYKLGDEFKPFHPSASHVSPEWRDGWNACFIAAIAALQAEPQGWRPIETAPKDAHALLWIDIAIGQPLVVQGCWFHDDDADEKGWIDLDGNVLNATHWMPLPATPPKD